MTPKTIRVLIVDDHAIAPGTSQGLSAKAYVRYLRPRATYK
jgi:hypothetical protein